ncbi:hypothetical protein [Acinetobacter radioresistens]|uniref:hypothetical protein n=1 Tax=Acinetobacter radioresistens TaxID=40216 RepID=UPI0009464AA7|nr:hypothetical protein [Acinetobacter radioresistens]
MDIILKRIAEFTIDSCTLNLSSTLDHEGFIVIKDFWDINQLSYIQNNNISGCSLNQLIKSQNTLFFLREGQLNLFNNIFTNIVDVKDLPKERTGLCSFNSKAGILVSEQILLSSFVCLTNFTNMKGTSLKLVTGSHTWEEASSFQNSYNLAIEAHIRTSDIALMSTNLLYEISPIC